MFPQPLGGIVLLCINNQILSRDFDLCLPHPVSTAKLWNHSLVCFLALSLSLWPSKSVILHSLRNSLRLG